MHTSPSFSLLLCVLCICLQQGRCEYILKRSSFKSTRVSMIRNTPPTLARDKTRIATVNVFQDKRVTNSCDAETGHLKKVPEKTLTVQMLQVLGFSWENCGQAKDPAVMKSLALSPDPISIPGDLKASAAGSTAVALTSPLAVNLTVEKEVYGVWVKVPCVEEIGSCDYTDVCQLLDKAIPPGQACPEPLHTYDIPCHCPFKTGDYTLPETDFYLPNVDLPYWLTNGNYRVEGVLGNGGLELGCLKVTFSVHSN